jgi:hypothetical protein
MLMEYDWRREAESTRMCKPPVDLKDGSWLFDVDEKWHKTIAAYRQSCLLGCVAFMASGRKQMMAIAILHLTSRSTGRQPVSFRQSHSKVLLGTIKSSVDIESEISVNNEQQLLLKKSINTFKKEY